MLAPLIRTMRPRQWVKNVFVLAPLVFAESLADGQRLQRVTLAFGIFCLMASAIYLLNDLIDREADRRHPLKRNRPLASGALSPGIALVTLILLAGTALASSTLLGTPSFVVSALYLGINLAYCFGLKHVFVLDAMAVSSGYVLRVVLGGFAAEVPVSDWLLLCTTFLALFLTFSKRRHELVLLAEGASDQRQVLEHYSETLLDQLINVVTASSLICYALYALDVTTQERFGGRILLATLPFVLFGIFRYLYLIYREVDELNPTESMLRDLPFVANGVLYAVMVLWIVYF